MCLRTVLRMIKRRSDAFVCNNLYTLEIGHYFCERQFSDEVLSSSATHQGFLEVARISLRGAS